MNRSYRLIFRQNCPFKGLDEKCSVPKDIIYPARSVIPQLSEVRKGISMLLWPDPKTNQAPSSKGVVRRRRLNSGAAEGVGADSDLPMSLGCFWQPWNLTKRIIHSQ